MGYGLGGGIGALIGGAGRITRRIIIIMEKIKQVWALAKAHPKIATAVVVVVIAIYFLAN